MATKKQQSSKYVFDLAIKSKCGGVTIQWNPTAGKWEALSKDGTSLGRRRNVSVLVSVVNGERIPAALANNGE